MVKYLAFVLALASFGWAQGQWVVQDNPFNGNDSIVFFDVHAVDSLHCWTVGYHELGGLWVLKTSDGGKNWKTKGLDYKQAYNNTWTLNERGSGGIAFVDSLHGWIVAGRYVFSTNDGGENWETNVPEPTFMSYSDVSFTDTLKGWMITAGYITPPFKGRIYHTANNGANWLIQDSLTINLNGVYFLDSLKGFVVGDSGTLLRTTDGGEHWTKIETGTTKDLMDVQFADSLHGIAVGWYGMILSTVNGGETWTVETSGTDAHLFDVAYPDISHAWATGMFFSNDKGKTWEYIEPPVWVNLYAVSFTDSLHGWCVGNWGRIIHYGPKVGIEEKIIANKNYESYELNISPNPFKQISNIEYQIPYSGYVTLKVYTGTGSLIGSLVNAGKSAGPYKVNWNTKDLASGIYFLKLELNNTIKVYKKAVLIN